MVVFLSIGYLFTAAPGQSVGNWLDATIDMVSRIVASAPPTAASKKMPALEDKLAQLVVPTPLPVAPHNDDIKINGNTIQKKTYLSVKCLIRILTLPMRKLMITACNQGLS